MEKHSASHIVWFNMLSLISLMQVFKRKKKLKKFSTFIGKTFSMPHCLVQYVISDFTYAGVQKKKKIKQIQQLHWKKNCMPHCLVHYVISDFTYAGVQKKIKIKKKFRGFIGKKTACDNVGFNMCSLLSFMHGLKTENKKITAALFEKFQHATLLGLICVL